MMLNSAISWGNRPIQLCARLHGQCEIHLYCEGEDRAWLADLIEEGIGSGVFRPEPMGHDGWPKLVTFLRGSDREPVVASYSVTGSFPDYDCAPEGALRRDADGEIDEVSWDEVDTAQQWEWGLAKLRADPHLRLCPDSLDALFGDGMTGHEFMRRVRQISR